MKTSRIHLLLLSVAFSIQSASAEYFNPMPLLNAGEANMKAAKFGAAKKNFEQVLQEAAEHQEDVTGLSYGTAFEGLALISHREGNDKQAIKYLKTAMSIRQARAGGSGMPVMWNQLAAYMLALGQRKEAEDILYRVMASPVGNNVPMRSMPRSTVADPEKLGLLYLNSIPGWYFGTEAEAEPLLEYAYLQKRKKFGPSSPETLAAANNWAKALNASHREAEAVQLIASLQAGAKTNTVSTMNLLGQKLSSYLTQNKIPEATATAKEMIAYSKTCSPRDALKCAETLKAGGIAMSQNRQPGMVTTLKEAEVAVYKRGATPECAKAGIQASVDLARMYEAAGNNAAYAKLASASLNDATKSGDSLEKRAALFQLARAAHNNHQYSQAVSYYEQALQEMRKAGPQERFSVTNVLQELGDEYALAGKPTDAENCYKRAVALWNGQSVQAPKIVVLGHYAELLRKQKRNAEANRIAKEADAIADKESGCSLHHVVVMPYGVGGTITDW